jgi:hypothetical protein
VANVSDQGWADTCAAAGRTPGDEVRAELAAVLFDEYPAFAYDRKRALAARNRAERMLKNLAAFAADHQAQFPRADEIKTERDRFYIERLRRRAEAVWLIARKFKRLRSKTKGARGRRVHAQHVQREMLYTGLCAIWLYRFGMPELSYSRPTGGGAPSGPLIRFMLACMRQIMPGDALPRPDTVAHAIERERAERAHLWDEVRQWKERHGDIAS